MKKIIATLLTGLIFLPACSQKPPQHEYKRITVPATCTEEGYEGEICTICQDCKIDTVLPKKAHTYTFTSLNLSGKKSTDFVYYTCTDCGAQEYSAVDPETIDMPILSVYGDISEMSKENKIRVSITYENGEKSLACDATMKWQGDSSLSYPKKNYNIQLLEAESDSKHKVTLNETWEKQSKYCLKANYIDFSHSRNVVSGQLYNEIVHSRTLQDEVSAVKNGGVVDGFPVLIFINDEYQGLYTLNIPKDKWMFGMDDDEGDGTVKQAVLMADSWSRSATLREPMNADFVSSGLDLEFCSTEDTIGSGWVSESFNAMIDFVNNNDGEAFISGIGEYVSVERTIDSMLYTWFIMGADNTGKNILWTTYDGTHWYSSMYDMDCTWGMYYTGELFCNPQEVSVQRYFEDEYFVNLLWTKLWRNFYSDIWKRYFELRTSILSTENIIAKFTEFNEKIPEIIRNSEKEVWSELPSKDTNNLQQIVDFTYKRTQTLDKYLFENPPTDLS